ncbi:Rv3235 family protein [Kitasatospora sp. GAS1066B]|uniref:Rv3235 family protein n=1 Tax=Kitasatospora sp. GAS1066B TaxID=3156271 RepID=UPI00351100A6
MAETAIRSTAGTTATATGAACGAGPMIHQLTGTRRPAPHRVPGRRPAPAHRPAPPRPPRHPRGACDGSGDSSGLAARFALRLVEVLAGLRPVGQLARHTTHDGYRQLARLAGDGPLRRAGQAARPRLARVHESAPGPGVLEVCVRVETGERHRMVAFRLERHWRTEQWQCAAVEAR